MGMAAGHERDKLFVQDQRELTLAKAIDLAESVRCARLASSLALPAPVSGASGYGAYNPQPVFNISKKEKCSHLRKMCPNECKVKLVSEGAEDDGDDGESLLNIRCVKGRPMTETVCIGGLILEFEIDSGSAVSVMSENTYLRYFKEVPLSATNKKLCGYTGKKIETIGVVLLPVSYNGRTHTLQVYVVQADGPPLLGRDFIRKFKLELAPVSDSAQAAAALAGGVRTVNTHGRTAGGLGREL
ncbi:hypothetical protein ACJJTC_014987 [Scirpophaga incertulas]